MSLDDTSVLCPKNAPPLVTFVIHCVVQDGTPLDTLILQNVSGQVYHLQGEHNAKNRL
jgi:hypothetical protein